MDAQEKRVARQQENSAAGIGRREVLRRLASGALLPLAALPLATAAQSVPVFPVAPNTIEPFFASCRSTGASNAASLGTTLPVLDPFNDIKTLDIGVVLIPGIGGALRIVMDLFWPSDQPDLTTLIMQRVQALVNSEIQATVLDNLANLIGHPAGAAGTPPTGLNGAYGVYLGLVQAYGERPDASNRDDLRNGAITLHQTFTTMAGSFAPASEPFTDWQQQILPYFAQFANLHLTFLRDLLWHGAAIGVDGKPGYGFDDGGPGSTMDQFRGYFHDTRDQYVQYASDQLTAIAASLEANYQSQRGVYEDNSPFGLEEYIMVATGAWYAKKKQNVTNSQMIHLVQDYRDLWRVMDQPQGGHVRLTRELYFGPYGAPDLQDIGLPGNGSGSPPDVPALTPTPDAPLYYVAASTGALITQGGRNFNFPSAVSLSRAGEPLNYPPYSGYGITLNEPQYGGPVIGVSVDIGHYASRTSNPFSNFTNTAGYLVSKLYFTQQNGFFSTIPNNNDGGWEMKGYAGNAVDVPSGHMLSSVATPSSVFQLYRNFGKTPTDLTYHSIGSITFGFKMIDPDLKPTHSLLKSLYVTAPEAMSLGDIHQVLLAGYALKGAQVSADQAVALFAEIENAAERYQWDEQRVIFSRRMNAWVAAPR